MSKQWNSKKGRCQERQVQKTFLLPFRGTSRLLTRKEKEKNNEKHTRECLSTWGSRGEMHCSEESCLQTGKNKRKPLTELCVKGHFTEDKDEGESNFRGIAKKSTLIWRKQKKRKIAEFQKKKKRENLTIYRGRTVQKSQETWCCKGRTERQQGERTRRRDRERDDQKVAHGKNLHCCEVLSGTVHGPDGISKFVEDRETGLFEDTGRCPEGRDQKLQSSCESAAKHWNGRKKGIPWWDMSRWWGQQCTWQAWTSRRPSGAHGPHFGQPQCTRMADCSPSTWQGHVWVRGRSFQFQQVLATRKRGSTTQIRDNV